MGGTIRSRCPRIAFVLVVAGATVASAAGQILYVKPVGTGADQVGQLRQVNADGTGDTAVAVPFADVLGPVLAPNTNQFAVSAVDPARPFQISRNVFTVDRATGAIQNATNFLDELNDDGTYTYVYAFYKAFSPDGTMVAVNSYYRSGGGGASETGTPILQIFPSDGSSGSIALVHADPFLDGTHHGGEGVDWSPVNADQIVAPIKWDAPLISGGGVGEATALFLAEPVTGAGSVRQLTFPRADATSNIATGEVTLWGEHDYQPKYSPNGTGVAYIRSFQLISSLRLVPDPYIESLRIASVDGTSDFEVASFQPGLYITRVDWSPDGTQLVFDAGPQAFNNGFPLSYAVPDTDAIFVINPDGSGLAQLLVAPAGQPSWAPLLAAPNLGNISTRLSVGTDDNVLIGGFIITGEGDKNVIVRAIGPSLGTFGVSGTLADPTLELHDQTGAVIASNDNWKDTQQSAIESTGLAPSDDLEAAIIKRLNPGSYTAIVRGKNNATGVGLVEAYGLDGTAQLANISTRGLVQTGDNVMIGGFIVSNSGTGMTEVIVRAIGPSLSAVGISGALADPTLELHDANGATVASNDDWKETQQSEIAATGLQPTSDKESAILQTLAAGAYTAIVQGKNNTTGVALVEAYNLH